MTIHCLSIDTYCRWSAENVHYNPVCTCSVHNILYIAYFDIAYIRHYLLKPCRIVYSKCANVVYRESNNARKKILLSSSLQVQNEEFLAGCFNFIFKCSMYALFILVISLHINNIKYPIKPHQNM